MGRISGTLSWVCALIMKRVLVGNKRVLSAFGGWLRWVAERWSYKYEYDVFMHSIFSPWTLTACARTSLRCMANARQVSIKSRAYPIRRGI